MGWVQREFASYWDAEFEATMLLTWERGVSHLTLVPRDMGQEAPRVSEALKSQGIHLLQGRYHTTL